MIYPSTTAEPFGNDNSTSISNIHSCSNLFSKLHNKLIRVTDTNLAHPRTHTQTQTDLQTQQDTDRHTQTATNTFNLHANPTLLNNYTPTTSSQMMWRFPTTNASICMPILPSTTIIPLPHHCGRNIPLNKLHTY